MKAEQHYCRGPLARMFNCLPNTRWISNPNLTFTNGRINPTQYESGRPDAFVISQGRIVCVECKADFGSVFLGDPSDPTNRTGWHYSQRNWYEYCAQGTSTPYYIGLWVYPVCSPKRIKLALAKLFLVPAPVWLDLEDKAKTKRLPLDNDVRGARKHSLTICHAFDSYRLRYFDGGWELPKTHPLVKILY